MTTSATTPPNVPQTSEQRHVEGWAQYYEYFHKLNADMQQTSEASAQRRRGSDAKITLKPTDSACFDAIARSIEASDKHIVRIDDDGSNPQRADGSRFLCEADLALVRAQLRAAAQSSSSNIEPDDHEDILLEAAQDIEVAVLSQLGDSARQSKRAADPAAGAAAIETLLWFGLALGEPPRSPQQQQMALQLEQQQQMEQRRQEEWRLPGLEAEPVEGACNLEVLSGEQSFPLSVEFDWQQAAGEVGLDDEAVHTPTLPRPLLTKEDLKGSVSQDSQDSEVTTCPIERFDSGSSTNSGDESRAMSVVSDFNDCSSETGASETTEAGATCVTLPSTNLLSARPVEGVETEGVEMLSNISSSQYSSPRDAASDRRCSRREARPPKQWDSQVEAPLLKWEKEQQQPRSKRRSAAKRHATGNAQGADTYETDGSEDFATQLGISSQLLEPDGCFMLLADCTPAKRQRSAAH